MVVRSRKTQRRKSLRLACWNMDGVRGRKIELEHFLSQHGVDICLLSETFLNSEQTFRLANYVCHRTERPTLGGGTANLHGRCIVHHSVPVKGLTDLEAIAIQVTLAGRPAIVLAVYLPPSPPVRGTELSTSLGGDGRYLWLVTSTPRTWIGTRD